MGWPLDSNQDAMLRNQSTVPSIKIVNNKNIDNPTNEGKYFLYTSSSPLLSPSTVNIKKSKLFVTAMKL